MSYFIGNPSYCCTVLHQATVLESNTVNEIDTVFNCYTVSPLSTVIVSVLQRKAGVLWRALYDRGRQPGALRRVVLQRKILRTLR